MIKTITDKSEYFYIDSSKVCMVTQITTRASFVQYEFKIGKGENKTYYIDELDSKEEVEEAKKEIEKKADKVLAGATGTNYDKIRKLEEWYKIYGCCISKQDYLGLRRIADDIESFDSLDDYIEYQQEIYERIERKIADYKHLRQP